MIKYIKKYQELFGIDINYYKKISPKFILFIINEYGREYYKKNHKLVFVGEYLNGEKMEKEENMMIMVN